MIRSQSTSDRRELHSKPIYQSFNVLPQSATLLAGNYSRSPIRDKSALHINLMGRGVALADIVGWRIGASKQFKVN